MAYMEVRSVLWVVVIGKQGVCLFLFRPNELVTVEVSSNISSSKHIGHYVVFPIFLYVGPVIPVK